MVKSVLRKISIGNKVLLGFGLLLLLLIMLGSLGVLGLNGVGNSFTSYRSLTTESNRLGALRNTVADAQINALRYVTAPNEEALATFQSLMTATLADLEARQTSSRDDIERQRLSALAESIQKYLTAFDAIVAKQGEVDALVGSIPKPGEEIQSSGDGKSLTKSGEDLDYQLADIIETSYYDENTDAMFYGSQMLRNLLQAQLWANRYLVSRDPAHYDTSIGFLDAYNENIGQLSEVLTDVGGKMAVNLARNSYNDFRETLGKVKALVEERRQMIDENLNQNGPAIGALAADFQQDNTAKQTRLGEQSSAEVAERITWTIGVALAGFLLGVGAAVLIGRDISNPVRRMTAAMNSIAQGDLDVEIPARARTDELGQMAGAGAGLQGKCRKRRAHECRTGRGRSPVRGREEGRHAGHGRRFRTVRRRGAFGCHPGSERYESRRRGHVQHRRDLHPTVQRGDDGGRRKLDQCGGGRRRDRRAQRLDLGDGPGR